MTTIPPALAALPALLVTAVPASAQAPDVIEVPGIVRDFLRAHPDFDVTPSHGVGHYAGNAATTIGGNHRPAFAGPGFRVGQQWTNKNGARIAPHMYRGSIAGFVLVDQPVTPPTYGVLDSWDSTAGPYGGTNVGPAPVFLDGSVMPVITPPATLPPSSGNVNYNNDVTLTADLRCDSLLVRKTLTVDGNIVIYCDGDFRLHTQAAIELAPGATLDLYFSSMSATWNHVMVNANTGDPSRVRIFNQGTDDLVLHNHSEVYAQVFSPTADMELANHGTLFGTFHGEGIVFLDNGNFHVDRPARVDACGLDFDDVPGAAAAPSTGGITSSSTFAQWFTDVLGTNLSTIHVLELHRDGDGVYEALLDDFHPVDDILYGNEGDPHNYLFTFAFSADFVYEACTDQFLEFAGADDCWIFVDDDLVIDLGGVQPGTDQVVEMDRLGLADGSVHQVRVFYAQRNRSTSSFNLRTNVQLQPLIYMVAGTAGFD